MKSLEEIIAIRAKQYDRIRKAQMAIAVIDAAITSDPRYVELLNDFDGDMETDLPDPHRLAKHLEVDFN